MTMTNALGRHITYQLQYRRCGKPYCRLCVGGMGHGPYWYAYWREGGRLHSAYIGRTAPAEMTPVERRRAEESAERHRMRYAGALAMGGAEVREVSA